MELFSRRNEELLGDAEKDFSASDVKRAYAELKAAENYFNNADDPDLIDFAIFGLEAAKKKYSYMLKKAREAYK